MTYCIPDGQGRARTARADDRQHCASGGERGARATSLDAVLEHSGAPRGSVYHHFPGGREQLLREATDYAGKYVARRLERTAADYPLARSTPCSTSTASLLASDFRAGCPVVAVAVESTEDGPDLRDDVVAAFDRWRQMFARGFAAAGIDAARSDELAMLVVASFEGALILSRSYRDLAPLENMRREIHTRRGGGARRAHDRLGSRPPASSASATAGSRSSSTVAGSPGSAATRRTPARRATPATRRCGSTATRTVRTASPRRCGARPTAATRRSTGTPRSPRSPRASSGSRDEHGGESIFYYGGGGQGNHLGGAYSGAFLRALGSRYRSSALAQEKTGEGWVEHSLYGSHTRGEFEHAEVSVFVGKNPWMSQSFPRARVVLREIAKDPERSMIVIDPVVTDTAKLADFHLRVRPGTDAWCLAAMVGGPRPGGPGRPRLPRGARERSRGRPRAPRPGRRPPLCRALRRRRGADPRGRAAHRRRRQRLGLRGPRHPAGAEQHPVLLRQQDAVDPDRQLRQPGRNAPAHVVGEPVPRPARCGRTPVTGARILAGSSPAT